MPDNDHTPFELAYLIPLVMLAKFASILFRIRHEPMPAPPAVLKDMDACRGEGWELPE